ncbi:MAG: hypothetical protein JSS44_08140 [Proteobacteria bacterium]|nr:hypothetical protein [Pseudomonadota bacterium]
MSKFARKKRHAFFISMLLAGVAIAGASITIDASSAPYSTCPAMQGVNYQSDLAVIEAAMSQAVGMYQTVNGIGSAPIGTSVTVNWTDKSKSKGTKITNSSDVAIDPNSISSSAPANNGGGGGGGDPGQGGNSSGSGGSQPGPGGCTGHCKGTVTVGPIQT